MRFTDFKSVKIRNSGRDKLTSVRTESLAPRGKPDKQARIRVTHGMYLDHQPVRHRSCKLEIAESDCGECTDRQMNRP